jgi:hypothetical protein
MPGPRLRTAVIVFAVGAVVGAVGLVVGLVRVVHVVTGGQVVTAPVTLHRQLDAGTWEVFERTGTRSGSFGVSFSSTSTVTLTPNDVTIDGPPGAVLTEYPSDIETLTRGNAQYTAAVSFSVDQAGAYDIEVRSPRPLQIIVAHSLADTVPSVLGWFALMGAGGLAAVAGLVMLIVGVVRRNRLAPASVPTGPAPGWYPDPGGSGGQRWWDGVRWSEHVTR